MQADIMEAKLINCCF